MAVAEIGASPSLSGRPVTGPAPRRPLPGSLADLAQRFPRNAGAMVGLIILSTIVLLAIFADLVRPYDPYAIQVVEKFQPPSLQHLMGTDDLGRDIFSRVLDGTRISFRVALLVLLVAGSIGLVLGALAGYAGGWVDELIMRVADIFLAFPSFLLAMAIVASLGPGIENAILAIGIAWWPRYARLLRGQVLSVKHDLYVDAARALGASTWRLMGVHILPNARAPLLVQSATDAGQAIIITASLSFVGLGAIPPMPEWGAMIAQARAYMISYWWVAAFPGLAISLTVAGYMFLGDGLRDLLDPKLRRR
jgi:peptide/nickel transport system permease protein